ncbi:hypothetical protein AB205_0207010, partial [Aquarana catesbeiana]
GVPPYISVPSGVLPYISVPSGVPPTSGVPRQWSPSYSRCPQAVVSLLTLVSPVESLLPYVSVPRHWSPSLHQVSPVEFLLKSVSPVKSPPHQCPQAVESLLHQVSPGSGVPPCIRCP